MRVRDATAEIPTAQFVTCAVLEANPSCATKEIYWQYFCVANFYTVDKINRLGSTVER